MVNYCEIKGNLGLGLRKIGQTREGPYRRSRTLLINHPLVRQPKELTERSACKHNNRSMYSNISLAVWNNIKPNLVEFMTKQTGRKTKQNGELEVRLLIPSLVQVH